MMELMNLYQSKIKSESKNSNDELTKVCFCKLNREI